MFGPDATDSFLSLKTKRKCRVFLNPFKGYFLVFGIIGLIKNNFETRILFKPLLGGVACDVHFITDHELTQTESAIFFSLVHSFPSKDLTIQN